MKTSAALLTLILSASALPLQAFAGDHGHGHGHGKHKEVFWDGNCKVEREYKKHGRVKEKRECRPDVVYMQPQVVHPQVVHPVVMQPVPVVVQPQSGVVIQATGAMRLP